jgi:hypothetical protein
MAITRQGYAQKILEQLNARDGDRYPLNLNNVEGLVCWMTAEGGNAANNPLNTTWVVDGHSTPLPGNSAGVQEYDSLEVGVTATVNTLLQHGGQDYSVILTSLRNGWKPWALLSRVVRNVPKWGTNIGDNSRESIDAFVAGVENRWADTGGAFTYVSST